MRLPVLFLLFVTSLAWRNAGAQDRIFRSNGDITEAKVKEIGQGYVTYKKWKNPDGPDYTMAISEIDKIIYENGTQEKFEGNSGLIPGEPIPPGFRKQNRNNDTQPPLRLGRRIFSFAPLQFSEDGVGLSIQYEKGIDKDGIMAWCIPLVVTFNLSNDQTTGNRQDPMVYLAPGLKFYPTSCFGTTKYAIGPSLVIGAGQKTVADNNSNYYYWSPTYTTHDKFILGVMVNNSININPSNHIYLGFDLGFGFSYINTLSGQNQGSSGMVQGGFKIGYRY